MSHTHFRFELCEHPSCKQWPNHGRFINGSHLDPSTSIPAFSKKAARQIVRALVDVGEIDSDEAGLIDAAIASSRLPADPTADDRLFQKFEGRAATEFLNRRYRVVPDQDGSGETRVETCQGECGHRNCGRYPTHAVFFYTGVVQPMPRIIFSHEHALAFIEEAAEIGMFTPTDVDALTDALGGIRLEKKTGRADLMAQRGSPHLQEILSYYFGIDEVPDGTKPAEFALCTDAPDGHPLRHGHFTVYGFGIADPVFSKPMADQALTKLVDDGFVDPSDVLRLANDIDATRLPREAIIERLGENIRDLLKSLFEDDDN
ncbi:hypothetical protein HY479_01065 [Candidatus Uhrbacteria bacterium]|nr:hypothetical protein [Candidatus Uhrbacteria bacterium]